MATTMRLSGVKKHYPRFSLKGVSFQMESGGILGLVGPNGAGKTTTIKIVMGLRKRDEGTIEVMGRSVGPTAAEYRRHVSFVYDESFYWASLTPTEIGLIIRLMSHRFDQRYFRELLDRYELPLRQTVGTYSRGMKTKLALAVAFARQCEIVILDEPTSGLDPIVRRLVLTELKNYARTRQSSVLLSTHVLSDVESVADSVVVLVNGAVEVCAPTKGIASQYAVISMPPNWRPGGLLPQETRIVRSASETSVLVPRSSTDAVMDGVPQDVSHATLDDVLYHLVKGQPQQEEAST